MKHPLLRKRAQKEGAEVAVNDQKKALAEHEEKRMSKVDYIKYQAMWSAFHDNPSAAHVARTTGVKKELAAFVIEVGWPEDEMPALSERLRKVRRMQQDVSDYDLAKANAENALFVRGIFLKLRKSFGAKFENFSLKEGALENMSPAQFLTMTKGIDTLAKLQAFLLNDGADRSIREVRRVGGEKGFAMNQKATGKLAALTDQLKTSLDTMKEKKIIEDIEVFDADFEELQSFESLDESEEEEAFEQAEEAQEEFD